MGYSYISHVLGNAETTMHHCKVCGYTVLPYACVNLAHGALDGDIRGEGFTGPGLGIGHKFGLLGRGFRAKLIEERAAPYG